MVSISFPIPTLVFLSSKGVLPLSNVEFFSFIPPEIPLSTLRLPCSLHNWFFVIFCGLGWGPTHHPLLWVWIVIFAMRHGESPKALSCFSCSFYKQCPWLFEFPLRLLSVSSCVGLGFGFGTPWCLSFKSSLASFVFAHPFCFTARNEFNFSFPLHHLT